MSELTKCNWCTLQWMKARAKARGVEIIVDKDENGWVRVRYSDYLDASAYFMELTEGCAC